MSIPARANHVRAYFFILAVCAVPSRCNADQFSPTCAPGTKQSFIVKPLDIDKNADWTVEAYCVNSANAAHGPAISFNLDMAGKKRLLWTGGYLEGKANGRWIFADSRQEENYKDGKLHGKWVVKRNGETMAYDYVDGIGTITWLFQNNDRVLIIATDGESLRSEIYNGKRRITKSFMKNGLRNGRETIITKTIDSDLTDSEINCDYVDDKPDGVCTFIDSRTASSKSVKYCAGRICGPITVVESGVKKVIDYNVDGVYTIPDPSLLMFWGQEPLRPRGWDLFDHFGRINRIHDPWGFPTKGRMKNGVPDGPWATVDRKLGCDVEWKDGKVDGNVVCWLNGHKTREESYKAGQLHGQVRRWQENGGLLFQARFSEGKIADGLVVVVMPGTDILTSGFIKDGAGLILSSLPNLYYSAEIDGGLPVIITRGLGSALEYQRKKYTDGVLSSYIYKDIPEKAGFCDYYSDGNERSRYVTSQIGTSETLFLRNGKNISTWTSYDGRQQTRSDEQLTVIGLDTLPQRSAAPIPKPTEVPKPQPPAPPTPPNRNNVILACNDRIGIFKGSNDKFIAMTALQGIVMVQWVFKKGNRVTTQDVAVGINQVETAEAKDGETIGFNCL